VLQELAERWGSDPQYSHCALVPLVAAFVLFTRRHSLPPARRSSLLGAGLVTAGLALDFVGEAGYFGFLRGLGFIVVLCGIFAALNGWRTMVWALPAMSLLLFAIPLPFRIHSALAEPLQKTVAYGTTSLLQLRGRPAIALGNVVSVGDERTGVADACSGVGMLFVFLFAAAVIAALSRRPLVDKLLVFAMAPVAGLAANILRVSATLEARAMGYQPDIVTKVHDVGGYLLGPVALVVLLFFLGVIAVVFPASKPADEPLQIAFQLGVADERDQIAPRRSRGIRPSAPGR